MTRTRQRIYQLLRWLFFLLSLAFLVRFACTTLDPAQWSAWLSPGMAWRMLLAALLFAGTALCSVLGWRVLLRHLHQRAPLLPVAAVFCVTQIAKYLPGNVGHHVGRVAMARSRLQVPASVSLQSILQESALACLAALLVSAGCVAVLPAGSFPVLQRPLAGGWPLTLLDALYLILVLGLSALALVNLGKRRGLGASSRAWRWLQGVAPSWPAVLQSLPAYLAIYAVNGIALWLIAGALMTVDAQDVLILAGAYSLSWIIGFLLPGAPGGLGVREAALALLLTGSYGADTVLALSLLSRVSSVAADLIIFAFGAGMGRLAGPAQRENLAIKEPRHDE